MDEFISLGAILLNVKNDISTGKAEDIWDKRSLYAEKKLCMMRKYQLSDLCCVAANTTVDDNNIEHLPSEIEAMDFGLYCYGRDLADVVSAAVQQKPGASIQELLQALNYYMVNDGFINFSQMKKRPVRWNIGIFPRFSAGQLKCELETRKADILARGRLLEYPLGSVLIESGNSDIATLCDLISYHSEWALYLCITLPFTEKEGFWTHILYHKQPISPIANPADKKLKQPRLIANIDAFSQAFAGTAPETLSKYLQSDSRIVEREYQWEQYMIRRYKQKGWEPTKKDTPYRVLPTDQYSSSDWRQVFDFLKYLSFPLESEISIS